MIEEYKSETGVDKWIRENVFTDTEYNGVLVEVGAATPDTISNSYHFRINGWRTIAIEPNPYFVELHQKAGSEVYGYACSNADEDGVPFTIVGTLDTYEVTGFTFHSFSHISDNSLLDKSIHENWVTAYNESDKVEIQTNVRKLNTILKELNLKRIDVLTIDVEGNEMKVLEGFDIKKYKPKVIVLENIEGHFNFHDILNPYGYEYQTTLGGYDEIFLLKK
jgi:FkbM family methyltransferase